MVENLGPSWYSFLFRGAFGSPNCDGVKLPDTPFTEPVHCDVLVAGGGPGGSTIAALLAERGRNVVLVEKDRHPRFHIGESLLPMNVMLFERMGIRDEIERIGMIKHGVEFISPNHNKSVTFDFANAIDKRFPYAYQVRRSVLDELLFNHARAKGATTIEGCRVDEVAQLADIEDPPGKRRRVAERQVLTGRA